MWGLSVLLVKPIWFVADERSCAIRLWSADNRRCEVKSDNVVSGHPLGVEGEHRRYSQDGDALVPLDDLLDQIVNSPALLKAR